MNSNELAHNRNHAQEPDQQAVVGLCELGRHAVFYAAVMGWAVFPLAPGAKTPLPGSHGCKDGTKDINQILDWWGAMPDANIGIATGPDSGCFVLDVDLYKPGTREVLEELAKKHGRFPKTVMATSARGGRHLYYRYPSEGIIANSNSFPHGIDVRGKGGYILAPPSLLDENGKHYTWNQGPDPKRLKEAPAWVLEYVLNGGRSTYHQGTTDWNEYIEPVSEGNRHQTLLSLAGRWFRSLPPNMAYQIMRSWNQTHITPPLDEEEVDNIAHYIAERELKKWSPKGGNNAHAQ